MKESTLAKIFLPKWQQKAGKDSYLCRNNTGAYEKNGHWIVYGIGLLKKIKKAWCVRGGGDYIGWTTKTLCELVSEETGCNSHDCCEDCTLQSKKVAVFTSEELKTIDDVVSKDQLEWQQKVIKAGGIANINREGEF